MSMDLYGKRFLCVGMARSGIAAAELLCKRGASVAIYDKKKAAELSDKLDSMGPYPFRYILGEEPSDYLLSCFQTLVLSPGAAPDQPMIVRAKELGVEVIGEVELAQRYATAPLIGITGTNGKTTTVSLCEALMQSFRPGSRAAGNIGTAFSDICLKVEAPDWIVLELSSFQLEMTEEFHPHVSAMLNITPDHLNRHHTMEAYVAAKERVFANQTEEDFAVLNAEDSYCRDMAKRLAAKENGPKLVFFSRTEEPECGVWTEQGQIFSNISGTKQYIADIGRMQIFGAHNEENALAAIACALCAGMPAEAVAKPLYAFAGVEHRIEYTATKNGVRYYNDSKATNPDSAVKGLLAMPGPTVLIGGGMDKKIPFDDWCRLFNGRVRKLILLGETKETIKACALSYGYPEDCIQLVGSLQEAVDACYEAALPGDSVLLSPACASWDMFESYEVRGRLFKEMACALKD